MEKEFEVCILKQAGISLFLYPHSLFLISIQEIDLIVDFWHCDQKGLLRM